MSWNPEDFSVEDHSRYSFSEYNRPSEPGILSYTDPQFYQAGGEGGVTPQAVLDAPTVPPPARPFPASAPQATTAGGYGTVQMSEYKGPTSLENYTDDAGEEQRAAAERGQADTAKKRKRGLAGLGGVGATIVGLLVKFKALLVILLDIKWVMVVGQIGLSSITALISIAAYSFLFGWAFAIGLVGLLFIHEMGHAIVMKLKGVPIGGMIFIPMLGAAVFMRRMPRNARDEAEVGIAGPIAGALASGVCLLIAHSMPYSPGIWAPLAYFGFFLNLFNLIPIIPLDGGRVLAAIDRRIWIVGFLALVGIQIWEWVALRNFSSIWLLIFIIMAASQFWLRGRTPNTPEAQAYYAVPLSERIALGLAYFGLAAALVLGMALAHSFMPYVN